MFKLIKLPCQFDLFVVGLSPVMLSGLGLEDLDGNTN